jgi:hypothetical protein
VTLQQIVASRQTTLQWLQACAIWKASVYANPGRWWGLNAWLPRGAR